MYRKFSQQIEEVLAELGWSKGGLAAKMGMTRSAISRILEREDQRSAAAIEQVAAALGKEPEYFDLYIAQRAREIVMEHSGFIPLMREILVAARGSKVIQHKRSKRTA